jgi:hypothetical protein
MQQLIGSCLGDSDAIHLGIMANQGLPTPGQAHIELKTVAAVFKSKIKRGGGILWNRGRRTCAAMTE